MKVGLAVEAFRKLTASSNSRKGRNFKVARFSMIREKNVMSVEKIEGCSSLAASIAGLHRRAAKATTSAKNDSLTEVCYYGSNYFIRTEHRCVMTDTK